MLKLTQISVCQRDNFQFIEQTKQLDELEWRYSFVSREEFQEKITFAEELLEKYGAEYVRNIEYIRVIGHLEMG